MSTNIDLYAHITSTEDGLFDLSIGRDVPGHPSHGAASRVGTFATVGEAVRYAQRRGVAPERIATA